MVEQVKNISDKKKKEYVFYTYVNLKLFLNHSGHRDNWLIYWNGDRNNDQASGWSPLISPDVTRKQNVFLKKPTEVTSRPVLRKCPFCCILQSVPLKLLLFLHKYNKIYCLC